MTSSSSPFFGVSVERDAIRTRPYRTYWHPPFPRSYGKYGTLGTSFDSHRSDPFRKRRVVRRVRKTMSFLDLLGKVDIVLRWKPGMTVVVVEWGEVVLLYRSFIEEGWSFKPVSPVSDSSLSEVFTVGSLSHETFTGPVVSDTLWKTSSTDYHYQEFLTGDPVVVVDPLNNLYV